MAYGDKVVTNYTGSFYAYYGEDNAVVFDTSYASIGKNNDVAKAYSFSKSSYSTFSVTVGSNGALKMFEESLVGHKVGDKIRVMIPASEGYVASDGAMKTGQSTTFDVDMVQTMSYTQFKEIYSKDLTAGVSATITTAYGWTGIAALSNADNMVTITNLPTAGQTYQYIGNDDSKYGKVSFQVNSVSDVVKVTMSLCSKPLFILLKIRLIPTIPPAWSIVGMIFGSPSPGMENKGRAGWPRPVSKIRLFLPVWIAYPSCPWPGA